MDIDGSTARGDPELVWPSWSLSLSLENTTGTTAGGLAYSRALAFSPTAVARRDADGNRGCGRVELMGELGMGMDAVAAAAPVVPV